MNDDRRKTYITNEEKKGLKKDNKLAQIGLTALKISLAALGVVGAGMISGTFLAGTAAAEILKGTAIGVSFVVARSIVRKKQQEKEEDENTKGRGL